MSNDARRDASPVECRATFTAGSKETTMMRRSLAGMFGAAAVAAVVTTGVVHAQTQDGAGAPAAGVERRGPGGPGGRGGPGHVGRGFGGPMAMLRQLDLTDEQRAQVRQVMDSHRDELRAIGERVMAAHGAQRAAVTAPQFDEQAVRTRAAELAAAEADAAVLQAKVHSEVFAVLTPEQQAKAAQLKAQREARAQQRQERFKQRQQRRVTPPAQQ
jgi:periplasmic protein CpxP/Spy